MGNRGKVIITSNVEDKKICMERALDLYKITNIKLEPRSAQLYSQADVAIVEQ